MLSFNLKRLFALRGIAYPHSQLVKLGLSNPTAWNLLENKVTSIKHKHLKKICELLHCTPNDIYDWQPAANTQNPDTHPLAALRRDNTAVRYNELLRSVPLDKIDEVANLLATLSNPE
jgi:DNA-binding Xre family transcriptional regulator